MTPDGTPSPGRSIDRRGPRARPARGLRLERLEPHEADWQRMDAHADRVLFQTREWLQFIARTQDAEPVVATVLRGDEEVGFFTGLIIRRYGVRILGSPFPGWTTWSMGFNLIDGVDRRSAAEALVRFGFKDLGCWHLELRDERLATADDLAGLGFESTPSVAFEVDLGLEEDEVFGRMSSACRRAVRKAAKSGVRIEEASGEAFADEYYAQLLDVFAKQSLTPTYPVERVRELIRCVHPTGRLLLLRAVAPDGHPIATGIFPAMNGKAYFWGGASWRSHQLLRPNEAIFWHAMRYWRDRGMTVMDLGGGGDYKRKFGPRELSVPFFRKSRVPGLGRLRDVASRILTRGRT
jgi:CelD/BcsL family acetyltransferase involved in cellulose biosynthesis